MAIRVTRPAIGAAIDLARRAGQGEAFQRRFQMERQLTQEALRIRQQQQQEQAFVAQREAQERAQQIQQSRFQQQQETKGQELAIRERETTLREEGEVRQRELGERRVGVSEQQVQLAERKLDEPPTLSLAQQAVDARFEIARQDKFRNQTINRLQKETNRVAKELASTRIRREKLEADRIRRELPAQKVEIARLRKQEDELTKGFESARSELDKSIDIDAQTREAISKDSAQQFQEETGRRVNDVPLNEQGQMSTNPADYIIGEIYRLPNGIIAVFNESGGLQEVE